ncbi:hypothetical protein [Sporosarcina sp. G11-34]|uniref:hypothetical protein n=1 Tax=Sporosarcina sp. G11-34 TaxID=2849605 RepID=UPI0022A9A6BD|nr:hypothetical protein [Sporosarcina sp. G11-34]MCZ2259808.1 hypothetical protein [Sporosarcina sp. G11-34]
MKTVQWQMQENFKFPASTGVPTGVETVKVTPRFTIDRTEASVRLTGIYHLAVNVEFDGEVNELSERIEDEDVIFIDDVDTQGETGYFEYAIPFNIDLPPEADDPLNIVTTNAVCEQNGQGALGLIWDVECSYRQVIIVQEESPEQKSAHAEAKLTAKADLEAEEKSEPEKESKVVLKTESAAESKTENEPVLEQEEATEILLETVSFTEKDEVLAFLMGLEDAYSATSFRSNDVPVQSES